MASAPRAGKPEVQVAKGCGLGNFTLPLATQAREVLGIEGSETLPSQKPASKIRSTSSLASPFCCA